MKYPLMLTLSLMLTLMCPSVPATESSKKQQKPSRKADRPNKAGCKSDAAKLCPGFHWGEGLGKCLEDHSSELSDTCRVDLKPSRAKQ